MYSLSYSCSGAESYSLYVPGKVCSISKAQILSASKVRRFLDKGSISAVIDVRSDAEWSQGHFTDAKHIPFQTVSETTLRKHELKKDDVIVFYCNTGQRAKHAANLLKSFGFKNVFYIASNYESLSTSIPSRSSFSEKYALPQAPVATA
jgi:phage shock protein E